MPSVRSLVVTAASLALALSLAVCDRDDPPRDARDGTDSDGTSEPDDSDGDGVLDVDDNCPLTPNPTQDDANVDGVGDACDTSLAGPWPQAESDHRLERVIPGLAEAFRVVESGAAQTGHGFAALDCPLACGGTCGLRFDLPADRRVVDVRGLTAPDDRAFLVLIDGRVDAGPRDDRFRVLALQTGSSLGALPEVALARAAAAASLDSVLPGAGDDVLYRDLLHVEAFDGARYLALLGVWHASGSSQDALVGFDPDTGAWRWTVRIGARYFHGNPFEPQGGVTAARVSPTGQVLFAKGGGLLVATLPRDGEVQDAAPLALEDDGVPFAVDSFALDDRGRIYTLGRATGEQPLCPEPVVQPLQLLRLRVFGPSGHLLDERSEPAHSFERLGPIQVERAREVVPGERPAWRALVRGFAPRGECVDVLLHYAKSPHTFSADEDDPSACPARFEAACRAWHPEPGVVTPNAAFCPCTGCEGLRQLCPPPLFGPAPDNLLSVYTFTGGADPDDLTFDHRNAIYGELEDHPFASSGHGLALNGGTLRNLLAVDADGSFQGSVIGLGPSAFFGEGPPGAAPDVLDVPFAAVLRVVAGRDVLSSGGAIDTFYVDQGSVALGRVGADSNLRARSVLRHTGPYENDYAVDLFRDTLLPLSGGRFLALYHWAGPSAPDLAQHTVELRLLEPLADAPPTRSMEPGVADPMPHIAACPPNSDDPCPTYPLGLTVTAAEVSDDDPIEVSCDPAPDPPDPSRDCRGDAAVRRWEAAQALTLAELAWSDIALDGSGLDSSIVVACDRASITVRVASGSDPHQGLMRCARWNELFRAGVLARQQTRPVLRAVTAPFRSLPDATRCATLAAPIPLRGIFIDPEPLVYRVDPPDAVEVGATATITVDATGAVILEIIAGAATFADGSELVTVAGGTPVELIADEEGVVLVRVTILDENGHPLRSVIIAITVEGPGLCGGSPDGTTLSICRTELATPVPAEADQPALHDPADGGVGVQLHDLSLRDEATDLSSSDFALPVAITRTHVSSRIPDQGGFMGGWHFGLDQRLAPVVPPASGEAPEDAPFLLEEGPDTRYYDIAFQDGTGRIDVFTHPKTSTTVSFGTSPAYWVYDHARQELVAKVFDAKVVTFTSPRERFDTLRSYTLVLQPGEQASQRHPFYRADNELHPAEQRFFELTSPDGGRRIFDCRGHLIKIIDPQFREIELVYGGPAHPLTKSRELTGIIDASGRTWAIAWRTTASYPRIATITDPFGRKVEYGYETRGDVARLTTVTRTLPGATGELRDTTRYSYDAAGRLTRVVDPGRSASEPSMVVEYAADGAVLRQRLGRAADTTPPAAATGTYAAVSDGAVWQFVRRASGVDVTDPLGVVQRHTLAPFAPGSARVVTAVAIDDDVFAGLDPRPSTARTEVLTRYAHDAQGQVIETTLPSGRATQESWDAYGKLVGRLDIPAPGFDDASLETTWTYATVNGSEWPSFRCQRMETETSPRGGTLVQVYAPFDATRPGRTCQVVRAEAPSTTLLNGERYAWGFDVDYVASGPARGEVAVEHVRADGRDVRTTTYTLAAIPAIEPDNDRRGGKVPIDRLGHTQSVTVSGASPAECPWPTPASTTTFETDLRGNVTRTRETVTATCSGEPCTTTLVTSTTVDGLDRVVEQRTDPDGRDHRMRWRYDERGELAAVETDLKDDFTAGDADFLVTPAPARTLVTEHHHDRMGRPWATITRAGDASTFSVSGLDAAGRTRFVLTPGTGVDAATLARVASAVAAGDARSVLGAEDVLAAGDDNLTRAPTPRGLALDPRLVLTRHDYDADGDVIATTVTDGARPVDGCPTCDAAHHRTERWYRDVEGRVRVYDPGRTDRVAEVAGVTHTVLQTIDYDGLGRVVEQATLDPAVCPGAPGTALQRVVTSDYVVDQPGKVQVYGDDGQFAMMGDGPTLHTRECHVERLLSETTYSYDQHGNRREAREAFFRGYGDHGAIGADRVARFAWDHEGRLLEEALIDADGAMAQHERSAYDHQGALCWRAAYGDSGVVREVTLQNDEAGHAVLERVAHHGDDPDEIVTYTRHEYDTLGRVTRVIDDLDQVAQRALYDSLDRPRAVQDLRGAWSETAWDGLGRVTLRARRHQDQSEETSVAWRGAQPVSETTHFVAGGAPSPRATKRYGYDVHGNAALVDGLGAGAAVERHFGESGELTRRFAPNGARFDHDVDGLGRTLRIAVTPPAAAPPGYAVADAVVARTGAKEFRYDGIGRLTLARNTSLAGAPIATSILRWDSHGNLWQDDTYHHAASGDAVRSRRADAVYDELGNITHLDHDGTDEHSIAYALAWDAAGRLTRLSGDETFSGGPFQHLRPTIDYRYAGDHVTRRSVAYVDDRAPGAGRTLTTTYAYDELGERYRLTHAEEGATGRIFESRRWWHGSDVALMANVVIKDGVEQGDLYPRFETAVSFGPSGAHLDAAPGAGLTDPLPSYGSFADNVFPSSYTALLHDGFGRTTQTFATTYSAGEGKPMLSRSASRHEGHRLVSEQTLSWDPTSYWGSPAQEVRSAVFDYDDGDAEGEHIRGASHRVVRGAPMTWAQFPLPLDDAGSLGGYPAYRPEARYHFDYGAGDVPLHDGCANGGATSCAGADTVGRHSFGYDYFDQLVLATADEPDACSEDGPLGNATTPVAVRYRVVYDALGRRIYEDYALPAGCTGPSQLAGERPRSFWYAGGELVDEIVSDTVDGVPGALGTLSYMRGASDDVPWIAATWPGHSAQWAALEDLNGQLIGLQDGRDHTRKRPEAADVFFRSYPAVPMADPYRWVMRWSGGFGESLGFGNLAYMAGFGFTIDLTQDRDAARAAAMEQANQGWWSSLVQRALLWANVVAAAVSWIPIVGDVVGLVVDVATLGYQFVQEGPSWALAGEALMSVGFAVVGIVGDVGGPPSWAAQAAVRGAKTAKVVRELGEGVVDAGHARRALKAGKAADKAGDATRTARALDKVNDARRLDDAKCVRGSCLPPGATCPCSMRSCFVAGTPVLTERGLVPIEALVEGDLVVALDAGSGGRGERVLEPVVRTYVTSDRPVIVLTLESAAGSERVEVTPEHPFWSAERGWVEAGALVPGEALVTADGGWLKVGAGTWTSAARATVYNVEVASAHTYFVGTSQAWVHNTSDKAACGAAFIVDTYSRNGDANVARNVGKQAIAKYNADHIPADSIMKVLGIVGYTKSGGITLNLPNWLHRLGRTYANKAKALLKEIDAARAGTKGSDPRVLSPRYQLAQDIRTYRRAVRELVKKPESALDDLERALLQAHKGTTARGNSLLEGAARTGLRSVIKENKAKFKDAFAHPLRSTWPKP